MKIKLYADNLSDATEVATAQTAASVIDNAAIASPDAHIDDDTPMTIDVEETNRKYASVSPNPSTLKRLAPDSEDSGSNSEGTTSLPSTEPSTTPDEAASSSGGSGSGRGARHGKKRLRFGSAEASPSPRGQSRSRHTQVPHPLGIKPLGNAFLADRNDRASSLGLFARFEDDFLLTFLSGFAEDPATIAKLEAVSHGFYAFINATNSIWREAFLLSFNGKMKRWCGSWKRTFVWHYKMDRAALDGKIKESTDGAQFALLDPPAPRIQSPYIFSDTLYHPFRLAMAPLEHLVAPACRVFTAIAKIDLAEPGSVAAFKDKFAYTNTPAIVQNAMPPKDWPCREWTLDKLAQRWPNRFFQCEAVRSRLPSYFSYSRNMQHLQEQTWQRLVDEDASEVQEVARLRSLSVSAAGSGPSSDESAPRDLSAPPLIDTPYIVSRVGPHMFSATADEGDSTFDPYAVPDESPFYLFDASFADDPHASLEWRVPKFFQQISSTPADAASQYDMSGVRSDLFSLLRLLRPDHRWIIAGPARSGSGWHKDPNGTSAWNAVLNGRKAWMMLPPHVTPPGVYVSEDEAEVTAPLSIAEWLLEFAQETRRLYGPEAARPEDRLLLEGVCEEGEVLYVPSGWWHLVINLEESVALTQNFVSPAELGIVLDFMKNKYDQLSGFKRSQQMHDGETAPVALAPGRQAASISSTITKPPADDDEDECDGAGFNVFELFCDRLGRFDRDLLDSSLKQVEQLEETRRTTCALLRRTAPVPVAAKARKANAGPSWWEKLKQNEPATRSDGADNTSSAGHTTNPTAAAESFSFSDQLTSSELELEDVPW
ncbi:putative hydroxylase [Pseudozyma hubeiensis]|nr:putative hydroxylase [Pseudozyma hubeiensis]